MSIKDRITQLEAMNWADIRDAAEAVGITEKPADQSWKDMAGAIALAESRAAAAADGTDPDNDDENDSESETVETTTPPDPEPEEQGTTEAEELPTPPVRESVTSQFFFAAIGVAHCSNCGEKVIKIDGVIQPCCDRQNIIYPPFN